MRITEKSKLIIIKFLFLFSIILFFRIIFYFFFFNNENTLAEEVIKAIIYGVRFDLRFISIVILPLVFISFFIKYKVLKKVSLIYLYAILFFIIIFYYGDFGSYSYLGNRIDASSLRFLTNIKESSKMIWESYPVVWILLSQILLIVLFNFTYKKIIQLIPIKEEGSKKLNILNSVVLLLLFSFFTYGSFKAYPLRWSEAFFSKNNSVNQLGQNPILYFYDSFKFRDNSFDIENTKKYYPIISKYLRVKENKELNFKRFINNKGKKKYNVVIVMMESMGAECMSYFGNPANITPTLDSLFTNSISFENSFVSIASTAKSVFASITGIPDIISIKSASRNPNITDQKIIMNEYKGYKKFYFLGGNANWANIRAVFQSNIDSLKIYEEGSYDEENRVDVWGISDYDLFKEANKILKDTYKKGEKFISYIQMSSNHRPYTYPKKEDSFIPLKKLKKGFLEKTGFNSLEQVNAFRYSDFNIKRFLERARESEYFDSTIFIFFGDHSVDLKHTNFMKRNEKLLGINNNHIPMIIYAPNILKEKVIIKEPTHLPDLFPTVTNLAGIPFNNYTLGVNALRENYKGVSFIKTSYKGKPAIRIITNKYLYTTTIGKPIEKELIDIKDGNSMKDIKGIFPKKTLELDSLARGFYESTKYLYFNNKK